MAMVGGDSTLIGTLGGGPDPVSQLLQTGPARDAQRRILHVQIPFIRCGVALVGLAI
jgi:hypothetical protein